MTTIPLTDRQLRELAYHRERAARIVVPPPDLAVVTSDARRWWNHSWSLYTYLRTLDLRGKRALVLGCGYGNDVVYLDELGARVSGCDLSPEALAVAARRTAPRDVDLRAMPCERLEYDDDAFDLVLAVDILHHCEVGEVLAEVRRVLRGGGLFVWDEVYTHRALTALRRSAFVERGLYPLLRNWVYGTDRPYVTADERKLDDREIDAVVASLDEVEHDWFYVLAGRLLPQDAKLACVLDRGLVKAALPFRRVLAARSLGRGRVLKASAPTSF